MLAGPVVRPETVPSIQGTNDGRVRERLTAAGVMEVSEAGTITFPRDHLFRSPSSAASALLGRTANGWREWKNAQGRTLSQVKRGWARAPGAFARSALISAAVTGQIDVRELVPEASAA